MHEGLQIGVLGRVEARTEARALDLGGAQQRRLLACLAERIGDAVNADRLADALWPSGNLPQDWRGAIRVAASRLRTSLEDESAVVSMGGAYRLHVNPSALDALRFDARLRSARECPDQREQATLVRSALDEWRGNAYEEFADEPWIEGEARRAARPRGGCCGGRVAGSDVRCIARHRRTARRSGHRRRHRPGTNSARHRRRRGRHLRGRRVRTRSTIGGDGTSARSGRRGGGGARR